MEEVAEYCKSRKNKIDAQQVVSYYQANGWRVGKSPMRDWKSVW